MRSVNQIKQIYIDETLNDSVIAKNIHKYHKLADTQLHYISKPREILDRFMQEGELAARDTLLVYPHKGNFFSTCPGSDGMVCCQYFVINLGQGCLFDCHYCYLQGFVNNPLLTIFGNLEELFVQLDQKTRNKNLHFRIGTGEYSDSLALEPLTGLSGCLIRYFANHPNATLELKTKSSHVDDILDLDHRGHTVVSWSLNPQEIISAIEEGTASLEERLGAAQKVVAAGYKVAFHLDPLIYFDGWEEKYHALVDRIFDQLSPDSVAWLSIGSFRYTPALKEVIQARFPEDELTRNGEMIQGNDRKYRYFKSTRQDMFCSLKKKIEAVDPRLFTYLCMESQHMWKNVYGFVPNSGKKLDALFDKRRQYLEELRVS